MIKLYVDATKSQIECIVIAVADPDAPTWDKTPVEGIFLSRKVENHE